MNFKTLQKKPRAFRFKEFGVDFQAYAFTKAGVGGGCCSDGLRGDFLS